MRATRLLLPLALLSACARDYEGDDAGECEDGADNDRDGLFDCFDLDCSGASACVGDEAPPEETDAPPQDTPSDTPSDTPTDTPDDTTPGWDGTGDRPPGPHDAERGLVSAWLQDHTNPRSAYGPTCVRINDPDWAAVFDPPDTTPDGYYYVFYRVQQNGTAARGQDCSRSFPGGCVDTDVIYVLDGHLWTGELPSQTVTVDPIAAPGCNVTVQTTSLVTDDGTVGELDLQITLDMSPACPADFLANDGCVFHHRYDLSWVRAE
jgi:hypothetical protein